MAGTTPVTTLEEFTLPLVRGVVPFGGYQLTRSFTHQSTLFFFFHFIEVVEISDKFAHYSFQLIAILGAYIILYDLLW